MKKKLFLNKQTITKLNDLEKKKIKGGTNTLITVGCDTEDGQSCQCTGTDTVNCTGEFCHTYQCPTHNC